jgi:hypothetical protein
MLLFLFAFLYSDRPYYDHESIMCMAQYLLNVQSKNRLEQKGLLKRFNINCYGNEKTIVDMRSEKAENYEKLKNMKNSKEYNKYFFKYIPSLDGKPKKESLMSNDGSITHIKHIKNNYMNKSKKYNKKYNKQTKKKGNKRYVKKLFGNIW